MSLEQLLKDTRETPAWTLQRRKLFKFLGGMGLMTLGLMILVAVIHSATSDRAQAELGGRKLAQEKQEDSEQLAELMRVQQKADELKNEIQTMKSGERPARGGGGGRGGSLAPAMAYDPGAGFVDLKKDADELYIPTGAVFQAQLLTPIKTSLNNTFVKAQVTEEYRMDMKRRIPKGSGLVGSAHLDTVLKGVIVTFDKLILPNGIETSIAGLALSRNALPEIDGLYFSNRDVTYGTALAFGFLSGFADAAKSRQTTIWGSQPEVTVENQVLAGLSTASFQVANQILNDIRSQAVEYTVVPAAERIFVALTRRYDVNQKGTK
jgi:hypothetical protein